PETRKADKGEVGPKLGSTFKLGFGLFPTRSRKPVQVTVGQKRERQHWLKWWTGSWDGQGNQRPCGQACHNTGTHRGRCDQPSVLVSMGHGERSDEKRCWRCPWVRRACLRPWMVPEQEQEWRGRQQDGEQSGNRKNGRRV